MNHDIFRSSDAGAPVISNTVNTLSLTLDAILVKGFSTQSITSLAHAAGVITANKTAHGHPNGAVISISGALPDTYNGRVTITSVPDADNFTYAPVGANPASTPATGTILSSGVGAKAGLGWELVATSGNMRTYRPRAGTRMSLGVNDVNAYAAQVRGFETKTIAGVASTSGTGLFPSAAQRASGLLWQKTDNIAGNRDWVAMGDDRRIFIMIDVSAIGNWNMGFFGDIVSYKTGDAYNSLIIGKMLTAPDATVDPVTLIDSLGPLQGLLTEAHYMPRSYSQAGSSVNVGKTADANRIRSGSSGCGTPGSSVVVYPDTISGALQLSRFYVYEPVNHCMRGHIPGFWCVCHDLLSMGGVANGDTFNGSDALNSMTFELRALYQTAIGSTVSAIAMETTPASDWS